MNNHLALFCQQMLMRETERRKEAEVTSLYTYQPLYSNLNIATNTDQSNR